MIKVSSADHKPSHKFLANAQANVQGEKSGSVDSSSKRQSDDNTPENQLLGSPSKQKQGKKRSARARIKRQTTNMDKALQSKLEIGANDSDVMSNQIDDMINNQIMKQKPEEKQNEEWDEHSSDSESDSSSAQDDDESISDSGFSEEDEEAEEDMSSGDQSQKSIQRKHMDQQVALLERALSLEKKGGNAEIDLNKLLENHDLTLFDQDSSGSESLDSQNNSSFMNTKKKKHKHKEFEDQNKDKDQIILGLRAPTQVCKEDRKLCLIYPNDKYKSLYWDTVVSVILLITCFLTPLNLAFSEELDLIGWYVIMNYIIDFLFLIDIFVNFMTAFHRDNHELVEHRWEIIKNYLTGWFIIDFLAIFPTEVFINLSNSNTENQSPSDQADFNEMVRITRVSKLYKLVRITRLLRLVKLLKQDNKVVNKFGSTLQASRAFERLSMFLLALVLMCHFVGCMWIFVGRTVPDEEAGTTGWIEAGGYTELTTT